MEEWNVLCGSKSAFWGGIEQFWGVGIAGFWGGVMGFCVCAGGTHLGMALGVLEFREFSWTCIFWDNSGWEIDVQNPPGGTSPAGIGFQGLAGPFSWCVMGGVTEVLQSLNPLGFFGGWRIFLGAGPHWGEPCSPKFTPLLSDLIFVTFPRSLCGTELTLQFLLHSFPPLLPGEFLSLTNVGGFF